MGQKARGFVDLSSTTVKSPFFFIYTPDSETPSLAETSHNISDVQ